MQRRVDVGRLEVIQHLAERQLRLTHTDGLVDPQPAEGDDAECGRGGDQPSDHEERSPRDRAEPAELHAHGRELDDGCDAERGGERHRRADRHGGDGGWCRPEPQHEHELRERCDADEHERPPTGVPRHAAGEDDARDAERGHARDVGSRERGDRLVAAAEHEVEQRTRCDEEGERRDGADRAGRQQRETERVRVVAGTWEQDQWDRRGREGRDAADDRQCGEPRPLRGREQVRGEQEILVLDTARSTKPANAAATGGRVPMSASTTATLRCRVTISAAYPAITMPAAAPVAPKATARAAPITRRTSGSAMRLAAARVWPPLAYKRPRSSPSSAAAGAATAKRMGSESGMWKRDASRGAADAIASMATAPKASACRRSRPVGASAPLAPRPAAGRFSNR